MLSRRAAVMIAVAGAVVLATAATAATPPPAAGTWTASTDRSDFTPDHPLHNFDGTFKVVGTTLEDFHGTERHTPNHPGFAKQFCITGQKVSFKKKLTIKHTTGTGDSGPFDNWDVPDQVVRVTLTLHGHTRTDDGEVQIHFPGGEPVNRVGSSLALSDCHLQFDISGP